MPGVMINDAEKQNSAQDSLDFGLAKKGQFDLLKKGQFDMSLHSDFSLMKKGQFDMDYSNSDFSLTKKGSFDATEIRAHTDDLFI